MTFKIHNIHPIYLRPVLESQESIPLYNTQAELQLLSKLRNQSYKAYIGQLKQLPTRDISTDLEITSTFDIVREEDNILAGGLIPTQREIFLDAIIPKVTPETVDLCFQETTALADLPIITFNYTFIIDGHHRWASICAINPRAKCRVVNFKEYNLTPIQFLKLLQGAIVMEEGELPEPPEGKYKINIYKASNKLITEYIEKHLSFEVLEAIKHNLNLRDIETTRKYYIQNVISMKYNNIPAVGSPSRELMPQTDGNDDILEIVEEETPVLATEQIRFTIIKN